MKRKPMQAFSQDHVSENLDALLELVQQGEEIQITVNGKAVARLMPVGVDESAGADADVPTEEVEQAFYGD